jgi:hypothetical protein
MRSFNINKYYNIYPQGLKGLWGLLVPLVILYRGLFGHKNLKGYSLEHRPSISPIGVVGGCVPQRSMGGGSYVNDFPHCSIDCAVAA